MTDLPEFNEFVEYIDAGGIHPVALDNHALDSALALTTIQQGYQHAASLGRTYNLTPEQLDAVRAAVLESYHQDVVAHEVVADDPVVIAERLEWVLAHPHWHLGATVAPPDGNGDGGVYFFPGDGNLYRCVTGHTVDDPGWTPPATPALWTRYYVEAWPQWVQPTGAQDGYQEDAQVTHNGQRWINIIAAPTLNVWEPGVYGWELQP